MAKKVTKKLVDESIYALLNITVKDQKTNDELVKRCVFMMLNEAARCLDEGIIRNARDGDIWCYFWYRLSAIFRWPIPLYGQYRC